MSINLQRLVGIDFGLKRIGIAISDGFKNFSLPLAKIERGKNDQETVKRLLEALKDYPSIESFVIGLPLHMDGRESEMTKVVRLFSTSLEQITNKPVFLFDERLTSKQAESLLRERLMRRKERAQVVDILSASIILQSYLDLQGCNKT